MCSSIWKEFSHRLFALDYKDRLKKESWLLNRLIIFFFCVYRFTLEFFVRCCLWDMNGKDWSLYYTKIYKVIEYYVVFWSITTAFLFSLLDPFYHNWFFWPFIILGTTRLLEILQAWISTNILSTDPRPYSAPRMLVLNILSYSQIIVIYAGFAFLAREYFIPNIPILCPHIRSIWDALYFSFTTITTMDSGFTPKYFLGHFLFYSEVLFGILFLIVVIQQVLSLYSKERSDK